MSVLAHVVRGGPQQNEPAATQALAYILNSSQSIVRSLVGLLSVAHVEFEPGRVDAEQGFEEGQPDLAIYDSDGRLRVFVENKFWAGLTKAQPVFYLSKLSKDSPSALIFVVPDQRVSTVWNELKDRCEAAGLEWTDAPKGSKDVRQASVDSKALLVVSWKSVLNRFLDVTVSEGLDPVRADVFQLQGLTECMNLGAFLPLRDDEANNQEVPNRLINYIDLIYPIIGVLKQKDLADTDGLAFAAAKYDTGHYFRIHSHKKFDAWIGIPLKRWRDEGISPLWCQIWGNGLNAKHFQTIPNLFKDIRTNGNKVWFPIRLKTGVEQERVIENAVAQIKRIATEVLSKISD